MLRINSLVILRKNALSCVFQLISSLVLAGVGFAASAVLTLAHAGAPTITTFDVPGAGTGDGKGTVPITVAPDGTVTGFIRTQTAERRGFVRDPHGNITVFDAPNAGTTPGQGTRAYSITPDGTISGWYNDAYNVVYAFVRTPEGIITAFAVSGAGTGAGQGTYSWWPEIAPDRTLTGYYVDNNNASHSFLRDRHGDITVFDVPGASDLGGGTQAAAINAPGVIVGNYFDVNGIAHGFIRSKQASITTFDVQGAAFGTYPLAINPSGAISGFYFDGTGTSHCFVRASGGAVTTIDAPPYATAGSTCVMAFITPDGTVAATYADGTTGNDHAFLRDPKGAITNADLPAGVNGTGISSIGVNGIVVGNYADSDFTVHGFIRTP